MRVTCLLFAALLLSACTELPKGVTPIQPFEVKRYMGTWYEIARLDHSFEHGLSRVSAQYSLREDGGVDVVNRGYNAPLHEWEEAAGKAYLMGPADQGYLKVSFFGPFYGAYGIFGLDQQNYEYAFVSGYNTDYLWLLSRTRTVSPEVLERFISESKRLGFPTDQLVMVEQE